MQQIKTNKICKFLAILNDAEVQFLKHLIDFRKGIKLLIDNHNLAADEVCARFGIKAQQYLAFVNGNWDYTIEHFCILNIWSMELEHIKFKEQQDRKQL